MNNDDMMWNIMGQHFCSYKVRVRGDKVRFCRNAYNVTGVCSHATCPLSNSQYATIIEHDDELYLYIKTAERAHLPRRQWEKVRLDAEFPKALAQLDENLQWWDRRQVNRIKARLLRLKQYLMRKRKMLQEPEVEYVSVNKRQEHKLLRREVKAERAARIELELERELLERLKKGTYDSVVNHNQQAFEQLLDEEEELLADEEAEEMDEDEEDDLSDFEMEAEDEAVPGVKEFVMDDDEDDFDDEEEQAPKSRHGAGAGRKKRQRVVIEQEEEHAGAPHRAEDLEW